MMALIKVLKILSVFSGTTSTVFSLSSCSTDTDCSLNGICNKSSGVCICDEPWIGSDCSYLDFLPADVTECGAGCAYHGKMTSFVRSPNPSDTSSWGGSVLYDDKTTQYFMAVAEFTHKCKLHTWTTNSAVSFAVSDTPEGPYRYHRNVIKPWAHNPQMIFIPDEELYAIFTLGDGVPIHGPEEDCSTNHGKNNERGVFNEVLQKSKRNLLSQEKQLNSIRTYSKQNTTRTVNFTIRYTDDPMRKEWKVHTAQIINFPVEYSFPGNWNPSPMIMKDGSTIRIMVHTNTSPWAGEVIVEARHWKGPYHPITTDITNCKKCQEDPFFWIDKRGYYHVLYHKMWDPQSQNTPLGSWSGGHSFSSDGKSWSEIKRCYNTTIRLNDSEDDSSSVEFTLYRRERPKILFDKDGHTLLYLFNGAQVTKGDDITYTLAVPLNVKANRKKSRGFQNKLLVS